MKRGALCPALAAVALVLAAAVVPAAPAHAEEPCVGARTYTEAGFDYALCGLPDLDQNHQRWRPHVAKPRFPGLPDEGDAFCAPTSTMDAFAYFAAHGFPWLRPGFADWEEAGRYVEMTRDLEAMASAMGTVPSEGTNWLGFIEGFQKWDAMRQPGLVGYSDPLVEVTEGEEVAITLRQLAEAGAGGAVVLLGLDFARYEVPPVPLASGETAPRQWYTIGGHVVAMSSALSPATIGLHDPATQVGEAPIQPHHFQSSYHQDLYTVTPVKALFGYEVEGKHDFAEEDDYPRIDEDAIDPLLEGGQTFIWSYSFIEPQRVTGWHPGGREVFVKSAVPNVPVTVLPLPGPIVDIAPDPLAAQDFYALSGSDEISLLDTATGASAQFAAADGQPQALAFSARSHTLFAAVGATLESFGPRGRPTASVVIPEGSALVADETGGGVFALSPTGLLTEYGPGLVSLGSVQLPALALPGQGRISLAMRRRTLYVHRDGQAIVALATLPAAPAGGASATSVRYVTLAHGAGSTGLAVDDAGRIFVADARGRLAEYGSRGKLLKRSPFAGRLMGSEIAVNTSFTDLGRHAHSIIDSHLP